MTEQVFMSVRAVAPGGFRRCGVRHTAQPVAYPLGDGCPFSDDQVRQMCDDPNLIVVFDLAEMPVGEPAPGQAAPGSAPATEPPSPAEVPVTEPAPAVPVDRGAAIRAAIGGVDMANPDNVTADGKPKVEAIEAVLGGDITAGERDQAWAEIEAAAKTD